MLRTTCNSARSALWSCSCARDTDGGKYRGRVEGRPNVQRRAYYCMPNTGSPRAGVPPCACPPPPVPGCGRRILPPADCRPEYIPPNPCCPVPPEDKGSYLKYKYIFMFVMLPAIFLQYIRAMSQPPPCKPICRDFEYMRIRRKVYPWRDGVKTLFHNDHANTLPNCETKCK